MNRLFLYTISLLAVLFSSCNKEADIIDVPAGESLVRLNVVMPEKTRAAYDALEESTLRIFSITSTPEGEVENLVRRYSPVSEVPAELYLTAGKYRFTVEAGDYSRASFDHKTYYGEVTRTLTAKSVEQISIECLIQNVGVSVEFDPTVKTIFNENYHTYVSIANSYDKAAAENGSAPALKFVQDKSTGYYLLPYKGIKNLSWGFYGKGTEHEIEKTGVIEAPQKGKLYGLKFNFSKTPDGSIVVNVNVREYESIHDDSFFFTPEPTVAVEGFNIDKVVPVSSSALKYSISAISKLSDITLVSGDSRIEVMKGGVISEALEGVSYAAKSEVDGTLTLDPAFFAAMKSGVNDITFEVADVDGGSVSVISKVAVPGFVQIADQDLWFAKGSAQVIVTEKGAKTVTVKIAEGENAGAEAQWKTFTAKAGADYMYTAEITGLTAGKKYTVKYAVEGVENPESFLAETEAGAQLPNAGMENWYKNGDIWYPFLSGEAPFWGTGNPGAASLGAQYSLTEGANDTRPGSAGKKSARLETKKPSIMGIGKLAAGNLFVGEFGAIEGMGGTVKMGKPFAFNAKPKALKLWYKYVGKGSDKGRIYVCLANFTNGSTYHIVNTNKAAQTSFSPDEEILYADKNDVGTKEANMLGYGDFITTGNVGEWTELVIPITYREKFAGEKPNVLLLTAAASWRGDYFEGSVGSLMFLDDIEFVY